MIKLNKKLNDKNYEMASKKKIKIYIKNKEKFYKMT